jgi:hypothetical protein
MSYRISEHYQSLPRYRDLIALVDKGLVHGVVVNFEHIEERAFFLDEDGSIWQKLHYGNWFALHRNMNAKTQGDREDKYCRFAPETQVREMKIKKARPARIKPDGYDFSTAKRYRCRKVDGIFYDLPLGAYFIARSKGGTWNKIVPTRRCNGQLFNAITKENGKFRYTFFDQSDQVKHLIEDKNYMNAEDILKDVLEPDTNLELDIQVKPQVPEEELIAKVQVTCVGFKVDFTLGEEDEHIQQCSATLKIGEKYCTTFTEDDKVVVAVEHEDLIITPIKNICRGFLVEIIAGCSDPIEVPLQLGSSMVVPIMSLTDEDEE